MAIRARAFDDAGGFDERFHLYFEESDFLRRVRGEIAYVPAARCRHLYNQSAAGSAEAAAAYAQSERDYLDKWGGGLAKRFEREIDVGRVLHPSAGEEGSITEASPLPTFETAAGCLAGEPDVPDDVWRVYKGNVLYMRALTRDGHILRAWTRTRIPA
jgi:hypothetical protein